MPVKPVRLSRAAATDVRGIQRYTLERWGAGQWRRYSDALENLFEQLGDNPTLGPNRDEVRIGLRSFPVGAHVVWYRNGDDILEIVRVLHASMDPDTRL